MTWKHLALACAMSFPLAGSQEPAQPGFDHAHGLLARVLDEFASGDRVDYLALSRRREDLDRYLLSLRACEPAEFAGWTRNEQCAFLIDAHNAFTLHAVLAHYPLDAAAGGDAVSLRDVGGKDSGKLWKERTVPLGRLLAEHGPERVSLEELAAALRRFEDARVHAALCDATLGSPALRPVPFTGAGLERELDAAARAWLADPLRARFDRASRRIELARRFQDHRADFERDAGSAVAWLARHAPAQERAWLAPVEPELASLPPPELASLPMDWRPNDVERE